MARKKKSEDMEEREELKDEGYEEKGGVGRGHAGEEGTGRIFDPDNEGMATDLGDEDEDII
jgi:hypothetical protein